MKSIEGLVRKACEVYGMIDAGDVVAVGVSGGKDSVALLNALAAYRRYAPVSFELKAIVLDPKFGGEQTDYGPLEQLCVQFGAECHIKRTELGTILFGQRQESNPCSLCARMRRGALHDMCNAFGCNKIALGHHMDDAVETLFLNLFHEGRLASFQPVTYLSRKNITLIRPLVLCAESQVRAYVETNRLPVVKSRCPVDGYSERQHIKDYCREMAKKYPGFLRRTFGAMQRANTSGFGEFIEQQRTDMNEKEQ